MTADETGHLDYLDRIVGSGVISLALADFARQVWSQAKAAAGGDLKVPAASSFESGRVYQSWRSGRRWLMADLIGDDGPTRCEWCFCDNGTKEMFGEDQLPGESLPAAVQELLSTRNFWGATCPMT